ncbi:homoserine dehydrogenase [Treponema sp.]
MDSNQKPFRVAILGCGTVGGGLARIILERQEALAVSAGRKLELAALVDLYPAKSASRHSIPLALFGTTEELSREEAAKRTDALIADPSIDAIVETMGGVSEYVRSVCERILKAGKYLVSANKALLAEQGAGLFAAADAAGKPLSYEAAVCGAIPIIRVVREAFAGDEVQSFSGIMNGTSNYILSKMQAEGLSFAEALNLAQEKGYAEADPTLDVGGGDAGHKLSILSQLAFGLSGANKELSVQGIQEVDQADLRAAAEMDCTIKLICHAQKEKDQNLVHASVCPMMVKNTNFLSRIDGATNAVRVLNRYSGEHILVGKGAGSLETGSAIAADLVSLARYGNTISNPVSNTNLELKNMDELPFPYTIIFETEDAPGITGLVATAIGKQGINIDTVGHNIHSGDSAIFAVETMACTRGSLRNAIEDIRGQRPGLFKREPKVFPVLY